MVVELVIGGLVVLVLSFLMHRSWSRERDTLSEGEPFNSPYRRYGSLALGALGLLIVVGGLVG